MTILKNQNQDADSKNVVSTSNFSSKEERTISPTNRDKEEDDVIVDWESKSNDDDDNYGDSDSRPDLGIDCTHNNDNMEDSSSGSSSSSSCCSGSSDVSRSSRGDVDVDLNHMNDVSKDEVRNENEDENDNHDEVHPNGRLTTTSDYHHPSTKTILPPSAAEAAVTFVEKRNHLCSMKDVTSYSVIHLNPTNTVSDDDDDDDESDDNGHNGKNRIGKDTKSHNVATIEQMNNHNNIHSALHGGVGAEGNDNENGCCTCSCHQELMEVRDENEELLRDLQTVIKENEDLLEEQRLMSAVHEELHMAHDELLKRYNHDTASSTTINVVQPPALSESDRASTTVTTAEITSTTNGRNNSTTTLSKTTEDQYERIVAGLQRELRRRSNKFKDERQTMENTIKDLQKQMAQLQEMTNEALARELMTRHEYERYRMTTSHPCRRRYSTSNHNNNNYADEMRHHDEEDKNNKDNKPQKEEQQDAASANAPVPSGAAATTGLSKVSSSLALSIYGGSGSAAAATSSQHHLFHTKNNHSHSRVVVLPTPPQRRRISFPSSTVSGQSSSSSSIVRSTTTRMKRVSTEPTSSMVFSSTANSDLHNETRAQTATQEEHCETPHDEATQQQPRRRPSLLQQQPHRQQMPTRKLFPRASRWLDSYWSPTNSAISAQEEQEGSRTTADETDAAALCTTNETHEGITTVDESTTGEQHHQSPEELARLWSSVMGPSRQIDPVIAWKCTKAASTVDETQKDTP